MQGVLLPSGHSEQMGPCPDCDGTGRVKVAEPEPAVTRKATVKSYPNCSKVLADVLDGKEVLAAKTWDYLKPLTTNGAGSFDTHVFNAPAKVEMHVTDDDLANFGGFEKESVAKVFPLRSKIVGNSYRDGVQVSAFRNKNPGNRVLLVPEPGNPHDEYALAVVIAKGTSQNSFFWTHVGYVPRDQAKELARIWPRYHGRLLVGEGRLIGHPGKEQSPEIIIESSFRNYFVDGQ